MRVIHGVSGHCRVMGHPVAVHRGIDARCLDGRVQRLDVKAHEVKLLLRPVDLGLGQPLLGLCEIHHRCGVGLQFLGAGQAELGLRFLNLELQTLAFLLGPSLLGLGFHHLRRRLRRRHCRG